MSCNIKEFADGQVIEVDISGKLTDEDYQRFVPLMEERIGQLGQARLLVVMQNFHGWDATALWDDLKFDFKHYNDIARLALVGDAKWEEGMAAFCKPFTSATIKYFESAKLEAARTWVAK